jgi:UDP-N-acetylmuramate--alanine ligase
LGRNAFFVENRDDLLDAMRPHFTPDTVVLLMGARDPSLEDFAMQMWKEL